jgi:hypothetical protein
MYLNTFALLLIFRRQVGAIGIADLLVTADAAQNGMTGVLESVTEAGHQASQ